MTFFATYPPWLAWPSADVYHLTVHTYATALMLRPPPGPSVVTVHDLGLQMGDSGAPPRSLRKLAAWGVDRLALRASRRSRSLITVSAWTRQTLVHKAGLARDRVTITPLGVDHLRFRQLPVTPAFRERYGLAEGPRYLLYVGSDEPRKNLPMLWRALAMMRRQCPDVLLLKVGRGYDPRVRADLVRRAAELGIDGSIRYFDDIPEDDLPLFYNLAEGLLMPSIFEGFGLPALEAMACGTPVIVSDRGSLPELTGDDGGIIVDPTDAGSIATAAISLLNDRDWAREIGRQGHERARQFTWDATVEGTLEVYRRVLASAE